MDDATVDGNKVVGFLKDNSVADVSCRRIVGEKGHTDFVRIVIPGKSAGDLCPCPPLRRGPDEVD